MKILRTLKNLIETNRFLSASFDLIASTPIYKKIISQRIKKITSNIKTNNSYHIIIETTNFCNARCIMCPHTTMKRPQKTMDKITFHQILSKIKKENITPTVFILNGFGEPLIDPQIINRIKSIKDSFPDSIIKFYSNFNLANQKLIDGLLSSGLDEINISFNGYNRQTYQKVMKIDYQKTLNNLRTLIKTKRKTHTKLLIRISMTLVKYNEETAQKFIKKWTPLVESVSVNKVHSYNDSVKNVDNKFKINFNKTAFPCRYLWDTITFDVDGNIILCCLDYESRYNFGNANNRSILSSFYSPKFNLIRKQHLSYKTKNIEICRHCYTPYKNGAEWLINELY